MKRSAYNKKNVGVSKKVKFNGDSIWIKNEFFSQFIPVNSSDELKIILSMKAGLKNNEIIEVFNIESKEFYSITKKYQNPHNMRFLASILKGDLGSLITIKNQIRKFKENFELKVLTEGLNLEKFADMYGISKKELSVFKKIEYKEEEKNEKRDLIKSEMEDFIELLQLDENFAFEKLDKQISEELNSKTLPDFLEHRNFSLPYEFYIYARKEYLGIYYYEREFYPFEDIVLKEYYPKIGIKILEVLKSTIENYEVRNREEYIYRLREFGINENIHLPHTLQFGMTAFDEELLNLFYTFDLKKSLPWLSDFETNLYFKATGKELIEIEEQINNPVDDIKMRQTINEFSMLNEVKYHQEFWTSKNYNLLKTSFEKEGIKGAHKIFPDIAKEKLLLKARQFGFYRKYTMLEKKKIRQAFEMGGLISVQKTFPKRTLRDLKNQIEFLGLQTFENLNDGTPIGLNTFEEIQEDIRKKISKQIREEEIAKIKKEIRIKERKKLELEISQEMYKKGFEEGKRKIEETNNNVMTNNFLCKLQSEGHEILDNVFGLMIRQTISEAISETPPVKFHTDLVDNIHKSIYQNFKREITRKFNENT